MLADIGSMADRMPSFARLTIVAQPQPRGIKGGDPPYAYSGVSAEQLTAVINGTIERIEEDAELAVDCSRFL